MKIEKYTYRNRNDFKAIFKCEACGAEDEAWGYDEAYYHKHILPDAKCEECGKSSKDMEKAA